ncbi:hypothetical protein DM80_3052 [Burkholderia multivorans]|nr:hypothetical protein DM80_3052 [Burkholderia multivorans]
MLLKRGLLLAYNAGFLSLQNTQRIYDFFRLSRH